MSVKAFGVRENSGICCRFGSVRIAWFYCSNRLSAVATVAVVAVLGLVRIAWFYGLNTGVLVLTAACVPAVLTLWLECMAVGGGFVLRLSSGQGLGRLSVGGQVCVYRS